MFHYEYIFPAILRVSSETNFGTTFCHEQSIQEMLRKARQQQQQKGKATQHNSPETVIF